MLYVTLGMDPGDGKIVVKWEGGDHLYDNAEALRAAIASLVKNQDVAISVSLKEVLGLGSDWMPGEYYPRDSPFP